MFSRASMVVSWSSGSAITHVTSKSWCNYHFSISDIEKGLGKPGLIFSIEGHFSEVVTPIIFTYIPMAIKLVQGRLGI